MAQRAMFLGPFFAVSGLMEDSAEVKSHFIATSGEADYRTLATTLQQRLSICRVGVGEGGEREGEGGRKSLSIVILQHELFKITHSVLKCPKTRTAALDFIQHFISINAKKSQIHVRPLPSPLTLTPTIICCTGRFKEVFFRCYPGQSIVCSPPTFCQN